MLSVMRFAVIAHRASETNCALLAAGWPGASSCLLSPGRALTQLEPGDVALGRLDVRPTLDGVERGVRLLAKLAAKGVRVLNPPSAILASHDKLLTARALKLAQLPHPATAYAVPGDSVDVELHPPLVVKPRFGSWGADIFRCDTAAELKRVLETVQTRPWFRTHGALVQELLPPQGYDLRLLVAAGRVVGAAERVARPGEWRTNVALGGTRRPAAPTARARALAVSAVAACRLDLAGVDLHPVGDTHVVLEVNGAMEFNNDYDLAGEDVYDAAAAALKLPRVAVAV